MNRIKDILITGSTSGIGLSIAETLIADNFNPIIHGRDYDKLQSAGDMLKISKERRFLVDLIENDEIKNLAELIQPLDGLVLNAGINKLKTIKSITRKDVSSIFQINFFANAILLKYLLKNKKIKNGASIVFISSMSGFYRSTIGNALYASTKAALDSLMRHTALELAVKQIRVNSVNPGAINTKLMDDLPIESGSIADDIMLYPLKRYGQVSEVANTVSFLLSDKSTFITGSNILVDGGFTLK
jgi:NAD(P)-dependent dehydrogenase (short-subunit alcohol dehydrogenase family)